MLFNVKITIKNQQILPKPTLHFTFCILLALIFLKAASVQAQEMMGIVNSSYSGVNGSIINPAHPVTSPYYFDLNIVGADIFLENNYIYLKKEEYKFSRFFKSNPQFPTHGINNDIITYDYYDASNKQAFGQIRVLGPSASLVFGRHSVGVITGARALLSLKNVPYDLAKFGYENLVFPPQYDIDYVDNKNIYAAALAWGEIGLNYSYVLKQQNMDYFAAGFTVKYLLGYAGGYAKTDNINYTMLDRDTLIINNLNAQFGLSLPLDYAANTMSNSPLFKGKGVGIDLGFVYEKKKKTTRNEKFYQLCSQSYTPYFFKIGVSLLDIGRIKFKQNARKYEVVDGSTFWPDLSNYSFSSVDLLSQDLSNRFYGNPNQIVTDDNIKVFLPTALSAQVDVNLISDWYLNGTLVQPLFYSPAQISRPAIMALTPRWQKTNVEFGVPVSLYNWYKPRIGLTARLGPLTFGTEKLSSFFNLTNFTGIDFYFAVKISLRKGNCKSDSNGTCGNNEYKKFIKKK